MSELNHASPARGVAGGVAATGVNAPVAPVGPVGPVGPVEPVGPVGPCGPTICPTSVQVLPPQT